MNKLIAFLKSLVSNPMPTKSELLYGFAIASIGTDVSPADKAPDELGCAESLTSLIAKVDPTIQWTNALSTASVQRDMEHGKHFREVYEPARGRIVMSATAFGIVGHCGILGDQIASDNWVIMSNNSFKDSTGVKGLFLENYTLKSWRLYFVTKKGLKLRFFEMI